VTPQGSVTIDRVAGTYVVEGEPWAKAVAGAHDLAPQWTLSEPLVEEPAAGLPGEDNADGPAGGVPYGENGGIGPGEGVPQIPTCAGIHEFEE
jgi:hypothetical protein